MTSAADLLASACAVVFDKDGTLTDLDARWAPFFESFIQGVAQRHEDGAIADALRALLGVVPGGLVPDLPAAVETGPHIRRLVIRELVSRRCDPSTAWAIVGKAEASARLGPLTPLGEVAATIRQLVASGRRVGIATSDGRRNTLAELSRLGVVDLIDAIRCGDDDGSVKPDPAVLLVMAADWGLMPADLLFVGDSRHDLRTARAAGVPFVAVSQRGRVEWSPDPGDACVTTIDELLA